MLALKYQHLLHFPYAQQMCLEIRGNNIHFQIPGYNVFTSKYKKKYLALRFCLWLFNWRYICVFSSASSNIRVLQRVFSFSISVQLTAQLSALSISSIWVVPFSTSILEISSWLFSMVYCKGVFPKESFVYFCPE